MSLKFKFALLLSCFILLFISGVSSQSEQWTLEKCIEHAKQNNLSVKLQQYQLDLTKTTLLQSKGMLLPSISGYASHSYNYGQTIDRFTNQFATDMVRSNNFYVSANMTLFNGFQLLNSVRRSQLDLRASSYDLQVVENEISLTIATAFLQILYSMEMTENARLQFELTTKQVDRTRKMLAAGAVAQNVLLNLEAQAAAEEYQLTTMETQEEMAILTLMQFLDMPAHSGFEIFVPEIEISQISLPYTAEYICAYAEQHQPEIKSAELRLESARKTHDISKGAYSPNLSFGFSMGTGYSGASQTLTGYNYVGMDTIGMTTGSPPEYVLSPVFQYLYEPISFKEQIDRNFNRTIGFNLTIPIFNSLQTYGNVKKSKINIYVAEANLQQSKLNLNKTIYQAHLDAVSALKLYNSALRQVEATKSSFRLAEERFELNDMIMLDYQDAKVKLNQAQSDLLRAKYELIFKMKVLDFYMGNEIKL